ncbi:YbaB/EbfC family nucleoid-associated protein [Glycomyces terrestris]|uniref:YbaB/EbfC family DNA-binding protein n=1 Tax=Glycomyces terrestris TaxID=2493553 RepID=A0A426UY59_9ACTN|nr:YbaB/EbfC family nucleoid-associated protein [Glycomyces terrestris]RRR99498.1 YbaB/EbfC family DNA-binding protein [Glycomyces terrestris]
MDNPLMDVEGARARLEAWKARAEQRAAETQAAALGLQALRITAADDNRIVDVTIDHTGNLLDVKCSDRITRQAAEHTSRAVVEAYRNAKRKLAEAAAEVVRDTVGADSATGRALLAGYAAGEEERP